MDLHLSKNQFTSTGVPGNAVQHTAFEVVLFIVVIALFWWFLIIPKQKDNNTLEADFKDLQGQEQRLRDNKQKLTAAIADVNSHKPELDIMDEALPLDNRVSKLYITLDALTQNTGMTVGNISIAFSGNDPMAGNKAALTSPYTVKRKVQKLTSTLNVIGTFDQFQTFLQKLETSGRLINVTSVDIDNGTEGKTDFNVSLEAYIYE